MSNNGPRGDVVGQVRSLFQSGAAAGLSDGQLLERFTSRRDGSAEPAFAALVERHGPTVLNVCLGVLRDRHDAEDAFQATFLVLARRAGSIRKRESVASWLYGVALRVASEARTAAARRRAHERKAGRPSATEDAGADQFDVGLLVHEELARLPDRYRLPVLLCGLEGLSHDEAADRLGWPVGTVKSRLARGKARLRARLSRKGLSPGDAPGLAALPAALAGESVRNALCVSAGKVAAGAIRGPIEELARGVILAMTLSHFLKVAALTAFGLGVLGAGLVAFAGGGAGEKPVVIQDPAAPAGEGKADDHETIVALERRVRELEQKVEAVLQSRQEAARRGDIDPDTVQKVRPRFDCLVEKVFVRTGQKVKKGDPLVALYSTDLAAAKNDYQIKYVQWRHDKNLYDLREKLVATGAVSQQVWVDTQNNEQKSRLELALARDKLEVFDEVPEEEIEALVEHLSDKPNGPRRFGRVEDKARMTLRARADGVVISRAVVPGNYYKNSDVLMEIRTGKP